MIYLIIQAVFGIFALEWALRRLARHRNQKNEKFNDPRVYECLRPDPEKWARWKFYPGAIFTMLTRIILLLVNALLLIFWWKLLTCGHDTQTKGPIKKGCRTALIRFFGRLAARIQFLAVGMYTTSSFKEADYSYYLGPDYKKNMNNKTTSTIVANHVSWLDAIVFGRRFMPAMAPKISMKHMPLVNVFAEAIGSLYIPRSGS